MKTNNETPARSKNRIQSFAIIAGILIAVICSLIVFQNSRASETSETNKFSLMKTSSAQISGKIILVKYVSLLAVLGLQK
jgi:hypothetical protein